MSGTEELRDIALSVTEDGTLTETQEESHSHDPVGEEEAEIAEAAAAASEDGLAEAMDGLENGSSASAD